MNQPNGSPMPDWIHISPAPTGLQHATVQRLWWSVRPGAIRQWGMYPSPYPDHETMDAGQVLVLRYGDQWWGLPVPYTDQCGTGCANPAHSKYHGPEGPRAFDPDAAPRASSGGSTAPAVGHS